MGLMTLHSRLQLINIRVRQIIILTTALRSADGRRGLLANRLQNSFTLCSRIYWRG